MLTSKLVTIDFTKKISGLRHTNVILIPNIRIFTRSFGEEYYFLIFITDVGEVEDVLLKTGVCLGTVILIDLMVVGR